MNRRELARALSATSCRIEDGKKHVHVRAPSGELVGIIPKGSLRHGHRGHGEANLRHLLKRLRADYPNGDSYPNGG